MGEPENVIRHRRLCEELNALYERKNHDYGDSFHLSYLEEGWAMVRIRLGDKLNRFKTLSRNSGNGRVDDESMRDTLIDLANYSLMAVLEMDRENAEVEKVLDAIAKTTTSVSGDRVGSTKTMSFF